MEASSMTMNCSDVGKNGWGPVVKDFAYQAKDWVAMGGWGSYIWIGNYVVKNNA